MFIYHPFVYKSSNCNFTANKNIWLYIIINVLLLRFVILIKMKYNFYYDNTKYNNYHVLKLIFN